MKFNIAAEELKEVVTALQGTASLASEESLAVASYLFEIDPSADGQRFRVVSNNNVQQHVRAINMQGVENAKNFVLGAQTLVNICANLPGDTEISFVVDEKTCVITSPLAKYTLQRNAAPQDFAMQLESNPEKAMKISQSNLKFLFEQTVFSAAKGDVRDYLNGVLIEANKKRIVAVATNGHRLATCELKNDTLGVAEDLTAVVPMKFAEEMVKVLEYNDNIVEVFFGESAVEARTGEYSLATKLLESRYPDWRKVIPKGHKWQLEMTKEDLVQAINRAMAIADAPDEIIVLSSDKKKLLLSVKNPVTNDEGVANLNAKSDGKAFEISFNAKYLSEAVTVAESDTIVMEMEDPTTAIKLYGKGSKESIFIIMPVKK